MWLGESPSDPTYYNEDYIKFDLSSIADTTIDSASIEVRPYHQYYNAPTATNTWLRRVTGSWTESAITWSNKPAVATGYVDVTGCVEGTQCAFSVTSLVQGWVSGTYSNYGIRLDENGNGPTYWKRLIASEQQTTTRPRLIVTNHDPVATPTTPTGPRNDRTLSWSYSDSGSDSQSHYELDVDTDSAFAAPLTYDGAAVASAATSASIPAAVALTSGTTYYWRIRVKNGTSWSAWAQTSFVWDATAPAAPSAPDLVSTSDSGSSSTDNLTNDATPSFSGTAESGATVTVYDGPAAVGSGTATGGVWTVTTSALGTGTHSVTAKATDSAGNSSNASGALSVTIDTSAAAPSAPDLTSASDTGSSSTDNITNDATPTFTGTAESGATVTVYDGTTAVGSGPASGGSWTITSSAMSAGTHSITAKAVDLAGNSSSSSAALSATIDTVAPAVPSTPDLDPASDTGASNTDNITGDTTPTFNGTAEAGATVTLYEGTTTLGSALATGGNWSTTVSLAAGSHPITAKATDVAGNMSAGSSALSVTIVTAPPSTPSTPDLVASSDTGASSIDDITSDTTPTFSGTADAGNTVTLYDGASAVGSATATGGSWTITTSALTGGVHSISAKATDAGGTPSGSSGAISVTIDTVDPSGSVSIDGGAVTASTTAVTLTLTSSDTPSGVALTEASNDNVAFTTVTGPSAPWTLTAGDGTKTVWLRITDLSGRVTTVSDTIVLTTCANATQLPSTYQATCWKYQQVAQGSGGGFEATTFDDTAWATGQGAFGSSGGCAVANNGSIHTAWATNTDLLVRRHIEMAPGATGVQVWLTIDNDITAIYWNGVQIGGPSSHENCANPDDRVFAVSPGLIIADNVLAIRARDRGSEAYFDARVITGGMPIETAPDGTILRENGATGGDPVETFSGAFTYSHTDVAIAGRGPTPTFTRSYSSADNRIGPMGPGWTHSYSARLREVGDGTGDLLFVRPNGNTDRFTRNNDESFSPQAATYAALIRNPDLTYTITEKTQQRWSFDKSGKLTAIADRYGNTSTLGYDANGRLTSISDPAGRGSLTLGYSNGLLTSVTDWATPARVVNYGYDASGRLETVTDREGKATTFAYDGSSQRISSITDARSHVALTLTYDGQGRVATQKDALGLSSGASTAFDYVVNGDGTRVTTVTSPPTSLEPSFSPTIEDHYSAQGWLTQRVSRPSSSETLTEGYTYDLIGNRTSVTDARGNRTDYCYDVNYSGGAIGGSRGNVTRIIGASPSSGGPRPVTLMSYDAKSNLAQTVAPMGVASGANVTCTTNLSAFSSAYAKDLAYDATGTRLLSLTTRFTDPDSGLQTAVTKFEYGDAANPGLVTRTIPPRGNASGSPDYSYATTSTYFASGSKAGLLAQVSDPLGNTRTYDYDAVGRMTSAVDPLGNAAGGVPADHRTEYVYDNEDRLRFLKQPAPASGGPQLVAETRYDAVGNAVVRIDAGGQVTSSSYDERDGLFQVRESTDPWTDPNAPPASVIATEYGYDAAGHVVRVTRAKGDAANERVTDYTYDGRGLVRAERQYPSWPSTSGALVTTTSYDPTGNRSTLVDPLGQTTSYGYDPQGRLISIDYSSADTPDVDYEYDANGDRTSMTDGTGTTTYTLDEADRATLVTTPGATTVGYRYDLDGNRTKLIYPDATSVTYGFDKAGRLQGLTDWASRSVAYAYFPDGALETATNPNGTVTTYAYDNARRATSVEHALGSTIFATHEYTLDSVGNVTGLDEGANSWTYDYDGLSRLTDVTGPDGNRAYTYDPVGNRTSKLLGGSTTYSFDRADRITSAGSTSIIVDAVGNTTAKGADTFAYDQANRLVEATVGGTTETYVYDGDGVRFSRMVGAGPAIRYVTDATSALPTTIADGSRKYVWGAGLAFAVDGSDLEVYHTDRLGSVRTITDATGSVIASHRTDEFGIETATTGSSDQPFGFTGEPSDPTGLSYLRARYYDPTLGRFLSRDTWSGSGAAPASLNRYVYAWNNPLSGTDPSGHWLNIAIGAVIGGIAGAVGSVVGDVVSGQPPDLGRAVVAGVGGAVTGGVCGATLGVGCLATGAVTSVVQYQTTPGATNPIDNPLPYVFNAVAGAVLGRVTGGAVLKQPAVTFTERVVPNVLERFSMNYPGWPGALFWSFMKSLTASGGQSGLGSLLNPPSAAASSWLKQPSGIPSWRPY